MPHTNEQKREYRAKRKAEGNPIKSGKKGVNSKSGKKAPAPLRPFVGVDGEALGARGYHLLALSTGEMIANTERSLSTVECLNFLLDHGRGVILVGYGINYDVNSWLYDLTAEQARELRKNHTLSVRLPRDGQLWTRKLQYIPHKFFRIGFTTRQGRDIWLVTVYDLMSFNQASFLGTVAPRSDAHKRGWGLASPEEMSLLEWGKAARGKFSTDCWDEMVAYNQCEMDLMAAMGEKMRRALEEVGIKLRMWHGPGALADAQLRAHQMEKHSWDGPRHIWEAWQRSYFGGWFQQFIVGLFARAFDYDLRGAYPAVNVTLPSGRGEWRHVTSYSGASWGVYRVSWDVGNGKGKNLLWPLTPFPWRSARGGISRPHYGQGWYAAPEVKAALELWGDQITVHEGWELDPTELLTFGWMEEFQRIRSAAKIQLERNDLTADERDHYSMIDRIAKLGYNSVYGKLCQTIGKRPFLNPFWASTITSTVRAAVLRAAATDPEAVISVQTDGLTTSRPLALNFAKVPGGWDEVATFEQYLAFQSGVSFHQADSEVVFKMRGGGRPEQARDTSFSLAKLTKQWLRDGPAGHVTVWRDVFSTFASALARGKYHTRCEWDTTTKIVSFRPGRGRQAGAWKRGQETLRWRLDDPREDYAQVSEVYEPMMFMQEDDMMEDEGLFEEDV